MGGFHDGWIDCIHKEEGDPGHRILGYFPEFAFSWYSLCPLVTILMEALSNSNRGGVISISPNCMTKVNKIVSNGEEALTNEVAPFLLSRRRRPHTGASSNIPSQSETIRGDVR